MSIPIFRQAQTEETLPGLGNILAQSISGGIQSGFQQQQARRQALQEQNIINNLLENIDQQGADPLTAILGSRLPSERQDQLIKSFQSRDELQRKQQANSLIDNLLRDQFVDQPGTIQPATPAESEFLSERVSSSEPRQNSRLSIEGIPDSKLSVIATHPDQRIRSIADAERRRRDSERRAFEADRKFENERALPFFKQIDTQRDDVRTKDSAGKLMLAAAEDGDLGFFSGDNLASVTGIDLFRTAKGQQFITAGKEYFLSNIQRAGTRPNQWIEQQIQSAMANIGTSREAQLTAIKTQLADTEVLKKKIEIADRLEQEFRDSQGFSPGNIAKLVDQELKPIADDVQLNLAYDLRKLFEQEQGIEAVQQNLDKKVPKGTPLTLTSAQLLLRKNKGDSEKAFSQAKRLGYVIPTADQFREWEE